jgi:hypothetical protein
MSREHDSIQFKTDFTEYLWNPITGAVDVVSTTREMWLAEMGARIIQDELAYRQEQRGGVHVPSTSILESYFRDTPDAGAFKIVKILPLKDEPLPEGAIE